MNDLDDRLARGPLRVRSLWSERSAEDAAHTILRRRRTFFALEVAAFAAFVMVGALLLRSGAHWLRDRPAPVAASPAPNVAAAPTAFADGSIAEPSSDDAKVVVEEESPRRVVARLTGSARFRVVHDPTRTFEVRTGDVRVRVLGTVFSVAQATGGQAQVLVENGRVEVEWLGGSTVLEGGQGGTFPPPPEAPALETLDASPPVDPSPASIAHVGGPRADWRAHARAGDYARAYDELHAKGNEPVRDEAEDLMLAADVARLSAHPEDAVRPLRAVCDRHPGDRRAPVAAFTLGRVLLDDLGRPAEAGAAFRKAHVAWPSGPLAEDALAREADAWNRAGRANDARAAASDYLARYPRGRQTAAMRQILTK